MHVPSGQYQVSVHTGTYQVRIEPPTGFEGGLEQVKIKPTTTEKYFIVRRIERKPPEIGLDLQMVKGTVLAETVRGQFSPVPEAELLFIRRQGVERFISSSNGQFSFRLPSESYRIQVKAKGFEPLETVTTVAAGMAPLRLVLKRVDVLEVGFHLNLAIGHRSISIQKRAPRRDQRTGSSLRHTIGTNDGRIGRDGSTRYR